MPKSIVLPSFAKGRLDPSLHGRGDTAAYHVGLATARNIEIAGTGGASNRPGLQFVGPCKTHTDGSSPRLIEFQFKTSDQYILEFGDAYMRVIRNDGHVVESTKTISGATAAAPVVVTATAHGYSNGDEVYITAVVGMTEINDQRFVVANKTTNTFELTHQVTGDDIDGSAFTAYSSAGTAARVYTLTTPYAIADVPRIKFVQSADVMTLAHPDYDPRELTRTGHSSWTLSTLDFVPDIIHPTAVTITVDGADNSVTYKYFVTAIDKDTGEESLPGITTTTHTITGVTAANPAVVTTNAGHNLESGDIIRITSIAGMTELNNRHFTIGATPTATTFELQNEDSTNYAAWASAGTVTDAFQVTAAGTTDPDNTITWGGSTNATKYNIYRRREIEPIGFIGETTGLTFKDNDITEDATAKPPQPRNPFIGQGKRPGTVSYYEQRRVFSGSSSFPDTKYYSQTGGHNNFSKHFSSPYGLSRADDAMTATLNSKKVNEIRHFIPLSDLIVLTSGSEWRINSGDNVGFSATTLQQKPQTYWGASHIPPIVAGDVVIYITDNGAQIRSLEYNTTVKKYLGTNLIELSKDLLEVYTATDWAFAAHPEGRAYIVRSDGGALTMTFNPFQEVVAWTTWDTDGLFESAAALEKTASDTEDAIYFVVKRKINGNTVRYIERTHSRIYNSVEDAFFVDSGLSLDSPITITDATAADPVVVTAASHGFSNGDEVIINDIEWEPDVSATFKETQPAQLNDAKFKVANKTANTFELTDLSDVDIDGSGYNAYVRNGEVRATATEIAGLRHLEGKTVVALAEGNVVANLTVSATGTITLPASVGRVHIGLRYISDIETLNIEEQRTVQGKRKKIIAVTVKLNRSRGLLIGPNEDKLVEIKQREFEKHGEPTNLLTGDKKVILKPEWKTNGRIFLRQKDPLPMSVLALIPEIEITK